MNVWILLFSNVGTEHVVGPFTSVAMDADRLIDTLSGVTLLKLDTLGWHTMPGTVGTHSIVVVDRFVIQQGGWESPWGERGR